MHQIIFAVKDRATDAFGQPMFLQTKPQAIRLFADEINKPHTEQRPNPLNQHPDDYDLYELGAYDPNEGRIVQERIELVIRGKDAIQPKGA